MHRRLYDALKGIGDDHGSQQCIIIEGAAEQLNIEASKKQPLRGLTPDETKDVITRFVCLIDSPWSIFDHKSFKESWQYSTQIEVDPPNAKVIKSWTIKMHQRMKETIAKGFTSVHHVTLTADAWTIEMDVACWVSQRIGLMLPGSTVSVYWHFESSSGSMTAKV